MRVSSVSDLTLLNRATEYALRALAYLAAAPGDWRDGRQISKTLGIPPNYLSKVLGQLTRIGVLESRKGWGGGFRIRGTAEAIPLRKVVQPFGGLDDDRRCAFGLEECSDEAPCPLHDYWKRIQAVYDSMLQEMTVADLARGRAADGRKA